MSSTVFKLLAKDLSKATPSASIQIHFGTKMPLNLTNQSFGLWVPYNCLKSEMLNIVPILR